MPSKKRATPISLQPLDALFGTNEETNNGICEIKIGSLHPFPNHPFQVKDDKKMEELSESITQYGVLVPGIVRLRESGGYELVAGHRRKRACELAGLEKMPVIIKDLTDDEATVIMVDSNIQREELLISEKAFAYKMKNEAMKRTGGRRKSSQSDYPLKGKKTVEIIGEEFGDSAKQVQRYLKLTDLIPELLEKLDNGELSFNPAVELSYLTIEEQKEFIDAMEYTQAVPSISQAQRMKKLSREKKLTGTKMREIMGEIKKGEITRVMFNNEQLYRYFPKSYTPAEMKEEILSICHRHMS